MIVSQSSLAQDVNPDEDTTQITREEWIRRVEHARERVMILRAQKHIGPRERSDLERAQENSDRAISDDLLRPGDIISTTRGLLIYKGKSGTGVSTGQTKDRIRNDEFAPMPR